MLSLKLLETYYWVARLRSFNAAADRLHVTQPSISYRIKELEGQIGRALIVRKGRSIRLTAQGQLLFGQAERMISAAQDLARQFRTGAPLTGALRLGVMDAFATICLPHLLRVMAERHPELEIAVMVDNSHMLTVRLDEGDIDLAVVSTPPILPGLRYERLGHQRIGWVGGAGHALVTAAAIAQSRVFVTPAPSNLEWITRAWFQAVGLDTPRLSNCNSMSAILSLVQANAGLSILPLPMIDAAVEKGMLHLLDVAPAIESQAIYAAYHKGALDEALPDALLAVRQVVEEQRFCPSQDSGGIEGR